LIFFFSFPIFLVFSVARRPQGNFADKAQQWFGLAFLMGTIIDNPREVLRLA
jgi:hypothetical protein